MYEKTYALDVSDLSDDQVRGILQTMFKALSVDAGPGTPSSLTAKLATLGAEAFLYFTGAPDTWLTTDRQRFAEACFAINRRCTMKEAHQRWAQDISWCPQNPLAHDVFAEATLDLEFVDRFGLAVAQWDKGLGMNGILTRVKKGIESESDRIRAVVGLSTLGFRDPMQFFRRR